jgi:hypothetical protein
MSQHHRPHTRVLLALDGCALGRELLATVLRRCVHLCPRLDILLINPPREPTSVLAVLLLQLEHSGVDYRVASVRGDMGEEILRYLSRYRGITAVAIAHPEQLNVEAKALIERKGHQLIFLATPEQAG